jgi:hypothetical protein
MRKWPHSQIYPVLYKPLCTFRKKNANNNRGPEIQPAIKIGHKLIATPISRDSKFGSKKGGSYSEIVDPTPKHTLSPV